VNDLGRREFLRRLTAAGLTAAGGWWLVGCSPDTLNPTPTTGPSAAPTRTILGEQTAQPPPASAEPTASAPPPTALPMASYPHLAVARGGEPQALMRRSLAALGGMERFVHSGDDVIIKPNICVGYHTYEYAATTNPWVVAELVRMCHEASAGRVRVMDQPFSSGPEEAYKVSGIQEQVEAAGGQMEIMSSFKFTRSAIPLGRDLKEWQLYEDALTCDVLINVPVAKDHSLARLTLGMKNLMGLIRDRPSMHRNLGQRLADLASRFQPTLTVVDAVRILTAHGPTGGNLGDVRQLDTVIVSPDIVSADAYAATLFGLRPEELSYVRAATDMGLGRSDLANLQVEELSLG
jgi:uncharacterized protein (DUF362 family)